MFLNAQDTMPQNMVSNEDKDGHKVELNHKNEAKEVL